MGSRRRSSIEAIERMVKDVHQSPAEHARERRLSLTMMNCIWARNTDVETSEPVAGEITGKQRIDKQRTNNTACYANSYVWNLLSENGFINKNAVIYRRSPS